MNGVIKLTGLEKGLKEEDIIYIYIYRVFYFPAWPICAGPTLAPMIYHRCNVRLISGRFNGRRRELDKGLQ